MAADRFRCQVGAGWFIGRFISGGRSRSLPCSDGDRYRGLDPATRRFNGHSWFEANVRTLFALGDCGVCFLTRSGWSHHEVGGRCCAHAASDGGAGSWRSTSVDAPVPDYRASLRNGIKGLRVGVPKEYRVAGMSAEIDKLWEQGITWLKDAGASVHEISLPHTKYALPAYYIVAPAEASSNLARYDGVRYGMRQTGSDLIDTYEQTRAAGFGREVKRRVLIGTYVLSAGYYDAYYLKAQKVRTLIKRDFDEAWDKVDVVLTPTTPSPAFAFGEKSGDPLAMYLEDIFTVTVNMAGLPGLSVPAGLSTEGPPLGLQLIGKPFDEETLLRTGQVIEDAAGRIVVPSHWWRG